MIAHVKANRRQALLNAFVGKMDTARIAIRDGDLDGLRRAHGEMLEVADSVESALGRRDYYGWRTCVAPASSV